MAVKSPMRVLGFMTGTSLDAVDMAVLETDGEEIIGLGPAGEKKLDPGVRALLEAAIADALRLKPGDPIPASFAPAAAAIAAEHVAAGEAFMRDNGILPGDLDLIGLQGQTVLHAPPGPDRAEGQTIQLIDAGAVARGLGVPTVYDLRSDDVAAGGQGAPFVPVYHRALAQSLEREGPLVVVNIGGVSNITYIDGADTLIACDTGPGNALLDDFMLRTMSKPFDCEGRLAAQGAVDEAWVAAAMQHPFFARLPPKSLDRNDFASLVLRDMPPADGAATLTALTAAAIARIVPLLPKPPKSWIVAGGGARNLTMLRMLRERLAPATVEAADTLGWSADAIEAQAFGFLAARGLKGLPLSYPATTGVPIPMTGGVIARP